MTSQLSILSNYAKHPKKTSAVLPTNPFYKSLVRAPIGQYIFLEAFLLLESFFLIL